MLFAMTPTLCAGRALPLPVYLKIHLVAGHVCVTEGQAERDLRPECKMAWVHVCVFVCLCWLYESFIHVAPSDRKSSCPSVTAVCVCVCVWACEGKELTLSFMTVSIMLRSSSLLLLCHQCSQLWGRGKRLPSIALIALWIVTLPCLLSEEETLTSSASSLSLLSAEMQLSAHEMATATTVPTLIPISQLEIFCLWEQTSESGLQLL